MIDFDKIYTKLDAHLKDICDTSFPEDRAKVGDKVNSFIVISLPSIISKTIVGRDIFETTLNIEVFVRDRVVKTSSNLVKLKQSSEIVKEIYAKFPAKFDDFVVNTSHDDIKFLNKSDGEGFHYSLIQLIVQTKN